MIGALRDQRIDLYIFSDCPARNYYTENGQAVEWSSYQKRLPQIENVYEYHSASLKMSLDMMVDSDIFIGSRSGLTQIVSLLTSKTSIVPECWLSYEGHINTLVIPPDLTLNTLNKVYSFMKEQGI